jgi:hypothetical protein
MVCHRSFARYVQEIPTTSRALEDLPWLGAARVHGLLVLYYFRWTGTAKELKEYVDIVNELADEIEGVNFKGIFSPTSELNCVILFEGTSYEKVLGLYKAYMMKDGPQSKIPVAKVEVLHTLEELGYPA